MMLVALAAMAGPAVGADAQSAPAGPAAPDESAPRAAAPATDPAATDPAAADPAAAEAEAALLAEFGPQLQKVAATASAEDDASLASDMLRRARTPGVSPALAALLCERACDLAAKAPLGHKVAIDAMTLLAALSPDRRAGCLERAAALEQKAFQAARGAQRESAADAAIDACLAAADALAARPDAPAACEMLKKALAVAAAVPDRKAEIQARLARQTARVRAAALADALRRQLEAAPEKAELRGALVLALVTDADDPAAAADALDDSCDDDMRKYVPAAAKGVDAAPEAACLEMARWYRGLADKCANACGKAACLERAAAYARRLQAIGPSRESDRMAADTMIAQCRETLARLFPPPPPGPWIDLLKTFTPGRDSPAGRWTLQRGVLAGSTPQEWAAAVLRVAPQGSYEVEVVFERTERKGDVAVFFPAGDGTAHVCLSKGAGRYSVIGGVGPGEREALGPPAKVEPGTLVNGNAYTLLIRVTQEDGVVAILATLGGKPYLAWRGPASAVYDENPAKIPNLRNVALGAWDAAVSFKSVRLRSLGGRVRAAP
jgi:hypothetical protein